MSWNIIKCCVSKELIQLWRMRKLSLLIILGSANAFAVILFHDSFNNIISSKEIGLMMYIPIMFVMIGISSVLSVLYMFMKELKYIEMVVFFGGMYGTLFYSSKLLELKIGNVFECVMPIVYIILLCVEFMIVKTIPKKKILINN